MRKTIDIFVIIFSYFFHNALSNCPNNCNSKGLCDIYSRCNCYDGYIGADCSLRQCPSGNAWSDVPIATDTAHQLAICSNRGICDNSKGVCNCLDGFTGHACERLACINDCNGNGKCLTMHERARTTRNEDSISYYYTDVWDAYKLQGCVCDLQYKSYDCSQQVCPTGDDPLTTGQVNDVQLLKCVASSGTFVLYFEGYPTSSINYFATANEVEKAFLSIPIISSINITFSQPKGTVCQTDTINVVFITFNQNFGDLPPLVPVLDDTMSLEGGYVDISADGVTSFEDTSTSITYTSTIGTKENDICSNRGLCDDSSGICYCYDTNGDAYGSSDGYGNAGTRGDCGYVVSSYDSAISSCPGELQCSGHGVCIESDYRCDCFDGWTSGDCSERLCPFGLSWYDYPTANDQAHTDLTECSDFGLCNRITGICECRHGFYGSACEFMSCNNDRTNGGQSEVACNGHGRCMSMSELALYATNNGDATNYTYGSNPNDPYTWDANKVHGCLCDEGYEGYDCSLKSCPVGDDPGTYNDHNEVQLFQCIADSGYITISFRQLISPKIYYNTTMNELSIILKDLLNKDIKVYYSKNYLYSSSQINTTLTDNLKPVKEKIETFPLWAKFGVNGSVVINPSNIGIETHIDSYLCSTTSNTQIILLYFITIPGDLPSIIIDTSNLYLSLTGGNGIVNIYTDGETVTGVDSSNKTHIYTSINGTTETDVCNNRGLCDYTTGICNCFPTWSSSNGMGQPGDLGDCGYRIENDYVKY